MSPDFVAPFSSVEFPTFNSEFITENGTPFETFMAFFRSEIRDLCFQVLKSSCAIRKEGNKHFSFKPKETDMFHWIGSHLMMENIITPFDCKDFREHFERTKKKATQDNISFPSLNRIEDLRATFIPSISDMDVFEDFVTTTCTTNVAMDLVHHIAIDESILETSARMENRKRTDVTKEQPQNSNGNIREKHLASLQNVPIASIPGKDHDGLQSISAAIKFRVKSRRTFDTEKSEYKDTVKRGYFLGIKFLKYEPAVWEDIYSYYGKKFNVKEHPKHAISDARFSSEQLFTSASHSGWKVTLSMKSTTPKYLWVLTDFVTKKDHSLILQNVEKQVMASCFHDGDKYFHLWTNYFIAQDNGAWDSEEIVSFQHMPESALIKLVTRRGITPAHSKNQLIYQLTGHLIVEPESSIPNPPTASTVWPEGYLTIEEMQLLSPTQLKKFLTKDVPAPIVKDMTRCLNLTLESTKVKNIDLLVSTLLPTSITASRQQQLNDFMGSCKTANVEGGAVVHEAYSNNFNAVDLADKIWYSGGKPQFVSTHWTQRLFFYIVRILVNNAWVLYELWEEITLGDFRYEVAKGLLNMKKKDLIKWL